MLCRRIKIHRIYNQTYSEYKHSLTCCHSNEIRAQIANPPNNTQLEGTRPTIPPSYIQVRAVVWQCGEGQTDRHTIGRNHNTFRLGSGYASREMY